MRCLSQSSTIMLSVLLQATGLPPTVSADALAQHSGLVDGSGGSAAGIAGEAGSWRPPWRVRRPAVQAAVPRLPPVHASPVQPAACDPRTGVLTVQHPSSFQSTQSSTAIGAPQEPAPVAVHEQGSTTGDYEDSVDEDAGSTHEAISGVDSSGPVDLNEQQGHPYNQLPAPQARPAADEAYRIARLWADQRFVARRLLVLVALAKRLMSLPEPHRGDAQAGVRARMRVCSRGIAGWLGSLCFSQPMISAVLSCRTAFAISRCPT